MMRWNREAAMLGIPDLPEEGFKHVGDRKIKPQGGGSGGGSQTSTSYTSSVPKWLESEQKDLVARGFALGQQDYQPYTGERISQFTPLQRTAFGQAERQQVAPQIGEATGLAGLAARQGLQAGQFQTGQFTPMGVQGPQLQQFQLGAPMGVGTQSFTQPGMAQQFMDPYMQNVVNIQQQAAQRQADIQATQRGAQAVRAGAFGGSRQAIENAEANRALASQMGEIQARGLQDAFGRAQEQFGREQQLGLQAQMANQQAGLTAGQANLQSLLGVQQLGAQTGMQAQLANQQALADAQRAFEQSRQFGADLGLRGGAQALQGAQTLGQLGQQRFGQEMDIMGRQRDFGAQQQQQIQRILDQQFADFQAQRDFPYQQLGFMSDLIQGRGGSTRQMYTTPQPNQLAQLAGAGLSAAALMRAEGGEIPAPKKYAAGGGITGLLPDQQLQERMDSPTVATIAKMAAEKELMDRNQLREGIAAMQQGVPQMPTQTVAEEMLTQMGIGSLPVPDEVMPDAAMAGGGIVAFEDGGVIEVPEGTAWWEIESIKLDNPGREVRVVPRNAGAGRGIAAGPTAEQLAQAFGPSTVSSGIAQGAQQTQDGAPAPQGGQPAQGGIASLSPAARMAEVKRLAGDGSQLRERAQQMGEAEIAAREADIRELQADQAEGAQFWADMRKKVESKVEGLSKDEYDSKTNQLLTIGATLLATDSPNFGTALGQALGAGVQVKQKDEERIRARKDALDARMDELAALERGEKRGDKKELRAAKSAYNNAKTDLAKALYQVDKDAFDRDFELAKSSVDAFAKEQSAQSIAATYAGGRSGAGAGGMTAYQMAQLREKAIDNVSKELEKNFKLRGEVAKNPNLREQLIQQQIQTILGTQQGTATGAPTSANISAADKLVGL